MAGSKFPNKDTARPDTESAGDHSQSGITTCPGRTFGPPADSSTTLNVGPPRHHACMDWDDLDDLDGVVDPLHPLHPYLFAEWVCPQCAEDGDLADLDDGRCPHCGSAVERQ